VAASSRRSTRFRPRSTSSFGYPIGVSEVVFDHNDGTVFSWCRRSVLADTGIVPFDRGG
jgi:hypothetical protein